MKRFYIFCSGLLIGGIASAENLEDVDEMVCAAGHAQICLETGDCYSTTPWELAMPDFVVIDLKKKTISTTKASQLNRVTEFTGVEKVDGLIVMQGIEYGRAFSFVIDELTGRMTVAIALDGMSVTVFGACTDTDIQ